MSWFELDHERSSLSQYLESNFSDTLSNVQAPLPRVLEMYVYLGNMCTWKICLVPNYKLLGTMLNAQNDSNVLGRDLTK